MPRAFDQNTGLRKPAGPVRAPAPQANQAKASPASRAGQAPMIRRDEVQKPIPAPGQAPSQTNQAPAEAGPQGPPMPQGPVETKREFQDPMTGETTTQSAKPEQGGLSPLGNEEEAQVATMQAQGTSMSPPEATEPPPPEKLSPLGKESPIEKFLSDQNTAGAIPLGAKHHMRNIGIPDKAMTPSERKSFEQLTVRTFQKFGRYHGDDDPNAPAPPIRPGKVNVNLSTGQIIIPDGQVDFVNKKLDMFKKQRGGA